MSKNKFGWGGRIAILYGGFVVLIATLVIGSMRQDFDLVADDYYQQEIEYQNVLDAGKNQSELSNPAAIHANESAVTIEFPQEFDEQLITGSVHFYSPVEDAWDKTMAMNNVQKTFIVSRAELQNTNYKIKLNWEANGKKYYQESEITLF
ncbi:MAG: FixH family protein [Chitinophagaceae bacterium]|nr:FixH family protein [Chitinophagaceae bacterium]